MAAENTAAKLEELVKAGLLTYTGYEVYKWLKRISGSEAISLTGLILNCRMENGDTHVDLNEIGGKNLSDVIFKEGVTHGMPDLPVPSKELIIDELNGKEKIASEFFYADEKDRIFFKRIYGYEAGISAFLKKISEKSLFSGKTDKTGNGSADGMVVSLNAEQEMVLDMFGTGKILIVSGGPGTGKTTIIRNLLKKITDANGTAGIRIALTAPTGKAVSRLTDSLSGVKGLNVVSGSGGIAGDGNNPECLQADYAVIDPPVTMHKLLGANTINTGFRYGEKNRLPYDVIIADEFSMVSLEMAYRFFMAVNDGSSVVILGDKDQLASVEMGAVMSEICSLEECNPLKDRLVELKKNYRFEENSGIGFLSALIKSKEFLTKKNNVLKKLFSNGFEDLKFIGSGGAAELEKIFNKIADIYFEKLKIFLESDNNITDEFISSVKILSPYNESGWGVRTLNEKIDGRLRLKLSGAGYCSRLEEWYPGRQIIIKANDYRNDLYNGDIGICAEVGGGKKVLFPGKSGGEHKYREFEPLLLPPHDLAFALSVHKSQGSEFDEVYFFIGKEEKEILSRELIYTAVTRARKRLEIIGDQGLFERSLKKGSKRKSVISELLCENK